MRTLILRFAGVRFLLGMLVLPTAAFAAPQLTITPQQGPSGALFVLTGVGFAPSTTYYLRVAAQDGTRMVEFDEPTIESADDGVILGDFRVDSTAPAGNYLASIATAASDGEVVASIAFAITGMGGVTPAPQIAITPSQASSDELFLLTGTGFAPGEAYTLRIQTENRQATIPLDNPELRADAEGVILSGFTLEATRGEGTYIAEVLTEGGSPTVAASARFTLVAPGASPAPSAVPSPPATGSGGTLPGLPNTGGGGGQGGLPRPAALGLATLGMGVLLTGGWLRRRRDARRR
jgi:hypothetical protein